MPRPKRTKVAPSKPITFAAIAVAKSKPYEPGLSLSPASGSVASSRKTNTSDDSDGIVTTNETGFNRRGVAPQLAIMSGALAVEDVGEERPRPLSSRKRVALSRIARDADHAKAAEALRAQKDAGTATAKSAKQGQQTELQAQSTQKAIPSIRSLGSPLSKTVHTVQDSQPTTAGAIKAAAPRETSILATANFKRRPRQPSLLQIARAQNAAEGSSIDDTLDDFNPDDQSTPLQQSKNGLHRECSSSTSGPQSSSRKRKLSVPEIQVPASQTRELPERSPSPAPSLSDMLPDVAAEDSQPNPPLPAIPTSRPINARKTIDSDTLAPPRSSSPASAQKPNPKTSSRVKKSHAVPATNTKAKKSKASKHSSIVLPPRSPSPTQISPSIASKKRSPLKPITTSALQTLLPRRRRVASRNKENNVFELNTSSDLDPHDTGTIDDDADELSYHATARPSGKAGAKKTKRADKKGKATAVNGLKSNVKSHHGTKKPSTTYTRKENLEQDENDEVGSASEAEGGGAVATDGKASEELTRMAAKFREVDNWGLEFEEVTGSSDRMRDAR
ncbi:MAG: hypothetical protein LQ346_001145 [Caloplaca aetnensis]|nr:MAG: hypothetical protein LQ346_001145 [Caloplaca aetnensis]